MAELADAWDLKSHVGNSVRVRAPPPAPPVKPLKILTFFDSEEVSFFVFAGRFYASSLLSSLAYLSFERLLTSR